MPELELDVPDLSDVGSRLNADYLARWIQEPQSLRPTATMPRLFPDSATGDQAELDSRARDVAAYLGSLGPRSKTGPKPTEETVQEGTRLFAHLGCISCHTPPGQADFSQDERQRIPLRDVVAKWQPAGLMAFLIQPDRHFKWVRMPKFGLSQEEATQLAAYLLSVEKRTIFPSLEGANPERGRQLVQSSGCLNCHTLTERDGKPLTNALRSPGYADIKPEKWDRGCMKAEVDPKRKAPVFALSKEQRQALRAFAADPRRSLQRDSAVEFAARQVKALRCQACHRRDEQEDAWSQLRDEEAGLLAGLPAVDPEKEPKQYKAEQIRPTLTWTGEKLNPEWMTALFAGKLPYKPRPYLRARMPAFPRRAEMLARGLAFEHGCPPRSDPAPAIDEKRAEIGRDLVSKKRWGCSACHDMGKTEAVGVFEAAGPNFILMKERLRRDYYDRWLWFPTRVEPGTKMPQVYTFGKPSLVADVLDGDAGKQIDAMWQYIQLGNQMKAPADN